MHLRENRRSYFSILRILFCLLLLLLSFFFFAVVLFMVRLFVLVILGVLVCVHVCGGRGRREGKLENEENKVIKNAGDEKKTWKKQMKKGMKNKHELEK